MNQKTKEQIVFEFFVEHPTAYISEIAASTGISKSSIQRYLQKRAKSLLDNGLTIGEQLQLNKDRGRKKGGEISFQNNEPTRDENGKFTGSVSSPTADNKVEAKKQDIIFLCTYYYDHFPITFEQMAEDLKDIPHFTKDYIYDCLTSPYLEEILGEEFAEEIRIKLDSSRNTFIKKVGHAVATLPDDLSPRERIVAGLRANNVDQNEVERMLGLSKGEVQSIEESAAEKLRGRK